MVKPEEVGLSSARLDRISNLALDRARNQDVRTVLDIDYRPVLWGLTKRGDGETRYIRSDTVTLFVANADRVLSVRLALEWAPILRQPVKTQFSLNGEGSHEDVSKAVHKGIQRSRREATGTGSLPGRSGAGL